MGTKEAVFNHSQLFRGSEWWLWEGHIGIQKSLNEGALFGVGQGKVAVFALISIAALAAIPYWMMKHGCRSYSRETIPLSVIAGGILGNLYDRLGFHGLSWEAFDATRAGERVYAVRDWILFQWNDQLIWPNFNIADSLLVVGTLLFIAQNYSANSDIVENTAEGKR